MAGGLYRVGIVCNRVKAPDSSVDQVADEWVIRSVRESGPHLPLLIPSLPEPLDPDDVLDGLDGLMVPGGVSNVTPGYYGARLDDPAMLTDPARDALTLPLIRAAIARGVPLICICRGFQELNVAFGGTLHQAVHRLTDRYDHRENKAVPADEQFDLAHPVALTEGGLLKTIMPDDQFLVNSLHGQGVNVLAARLQAEAYAPDGQLEAVSMPSAKGFVLGLQWHPEWRWSERVPSRAIFKAFSDAVSQSKV